MFVCAQMLCRCLDLAFLCPGHPASRVLLPPKLAFPTRRSSVLLERIALYLELEQLRFGEKLRYSIQVDPALDIAHLAIPSMIVQPFTENAIWHGILPRQGGTVDIAVKSSDNPFIQITVTDDGIGFNPQPKIEKKDHTSLGMLVTRERLDLLQEETGLVHGFEVGKGKNDKGTRITITLPMMYQ